MVRTGIVTVAEGNAPIGVTVFVAGTGVDVAGAAVAVAAGAVVLVAAAGVPVTAVAGVDVDVAGAVLPAPATPTASVPFIWAGWTPHSK